MTKKQDPALETAAELFLTAFNGKIFDHGALKRVPAGETRLDPAARWFKQTFSCLNNFELYVGISPEAAAALPGELTDFLKNAFRAMARGLETVAHSIVSCDSFAEEAAPQNIGSVAFELRREATRLGAVVVSVPESALNFLRHIIPDAVPAEPVASGQPAPQHGSLHMDALMNVDLPVSISFGSTEMPLADVLKLTTGSIVEFTHRLNEPVNVVVNGCLVARGDVVVVEGNYGVRISEVVAGAQPG
jgi:flagellar motor switch protein FliN